MAFIPVPNTAQVNIRYLQDDQQIQNTLYFTGIIPTDVAALTALASATQNAWTTNVMPLLSVACILREINVLGLGSDTDPSVSVVVSPEVPGGIGGDALPNNCALCVTFKTAGRGRSSRGRIYVPGLPESQSVRSFLVDGYPGDVRAAVGAACLAIEGATGTTHVVVSRVSNGQPRTEGLAQPVTTYALTDVVIDSQRRRSPGRGI